MAKNFTDIDVIGNTFLYKDQNGVLYGSQQWHLPHDTNPIELTHQGNPEDYGFNIPHDGFEAIAAEENLNLPIVAFKNVGPTSNWWYAKEIGDFYFQEFWYDWKTTGFGYEIKADETERIHEHEIIFIHDFDGDGFIGEPVATDDINKADEIDRPKITKQLINGNLNSDASLRGNRSPEFSGLASKNINLIIDLSDSNGSIIASKTIQSDENGVWRTRFDKPFSNLGYTPNKEVFSVVVHQIRSDSTEVLDPEPLEFIVDLSKPEPIRMSGLEALSLDRPLRILRKQELDHEKLGTIDVYVPHKNDTIYFSGSSDVLQNSFRSFGGIQLKVVIRDDQGKELSSQVYRDNVALTHKAENQWKISSQLGDNKLYQYDLLHIDEAGNESEPHTEYIYVSNGNIDNVRLADSSRSDHSEARNHEITRDYRPIIEFSGSSEIKQIVIIDSNGNILTTKTRSNLINEKWQAKINPYNELVQANDGIFNYTIQGLDHNNIIIAEHNGSFTLDSIQKRATSSSVRADLLDSINGSTQNEAFGSSVAISQTGLYVAVSAPKRLIGDDRRGAIDIFYSRNAKDLKQTTPTIQNPGRENDFGYAIKIAKNGEFVYATSPNYKGDPKNGKNKGAIFIFKNPNTTNSNINDWELIRTIDNNQEGILGLELEIDHESNHLIASLGPNNKIITKKVIYTIDENSGELSNPQTETLDDIQPHDQKLNQVARQLGENPNSTWSIKTYGYKVAGDPTYSSLNGVNSGSITYTDVINLAATLMNDQDQEIHESAQNQYRTNSQTIEFSGNSPERMAEVQFSIKYKQNAEVNEGLIKVDNKGDWSFEADFQKEGYYDVEILTNDIAGNEINRHQLTNFEVIIDRKSSAPRHIGLDNQKTRIFSKHLSISQSINPDKSRNKEVYQLEGTAEPFSKINIYYANQLSWKLSTTKILNDTNTWSHEISPKKDQTIYKKSKDKNFYSDFLVETIPQKSDSRPIFTGQAEPDGIIKLFAREIKDSNNINAWKLVGESNTTTTAWRVTPDQELTEGIYDFGFKFIDNAGNYSKIVKWSDTLTQQPNGAGLRKKTNVNNSHIVIDDETTKLINPSLNVANDNRFLQDTVNEIISSEQPTIQNKAGFSKGSLRKSVRSIPWKVYKALGKGKPQQLKDLEKANQLYMVAAKLGKSWSNNNEETLGFNVFNSLAAGTSLIDALYTIYKVKIDKSEIESIRNFHARLEPNDNRFPLTTIPTYPAGLNASQFKKNIVDKALLDNHQKFVHHHKSHYQQAVKTEALALEEWKHYKTELAKVKQTSPNYLPNADVILTQAIYDRFLAKERKLQNNVNNSWIAIQRARQNQAFFKNNQIDREFTRSNTYQNKVDHYKAKAFGLKAANSALGIGSKAFAFTSSPKKNNDLFIAQQAVGMTQNITDIFDSTLEGAKVAKSNFVKNADGTISKKAKNISTSFAVLGSGLAVAGNSLEIANYANRKREIEAQDCSKLHRNQKAINQCNKNNKLDIEALNGDIALRGIESGLALMEGTAAVASTTVKAGSSAAKFLKVGGPLLGATATAVSLFDNSQIREFEKKKARINGIEKRIETDFSASLLADGLTQQLEVQRGFNTAGKIVDGVTGFGSVIASAIPGGQPVALALAILGGGIATILSFVEASRLREEAEKIKDKMKKDKWGKPQSVEEFFDGSFLEKQQSLYDKITPQVDELLSKSAYDEVITINSQLLNETDIELASFTDSGGQLGKSAKHFVASRKKDDGANQWDNQETTLDPRTGTINLKPGKKPNRYISFFAPLNASGKENWKEVEKGKNEMLHELTIDDLGGWNINDLGETNSTFDLNDNIVTQAYKTLKDEKNKKITRIPVTIEAGGGKDQYFGNIAGIKFHGGGSYNSALEKDDELDTASYNSPVLDNKLATGIVISSSRSLNKFKPDPSGGTDSTDRSRELKLHLFRTLAWSKTRDSDINEIIDIVDSYQGLQPAERGTVSQSALVLKPMMAGVTYFKNSIKTHEKEGGKGEKTKKIQYQQLDKATNGSTQRVKDELVSVEIISTTSKSDFVDLTGLQMVKQLFTGDGDDYIYSGDNKNQMHIDTGSGNDKIHITNRPKTVLTSDGNDFINIHDQFLYDSGIQDPSLYKYKNTFISALTLIDAGAGEDTLKINEKMLDAILNDHGQEIYNKIASNSLARIVGSQSDALGETIYSMLPINEQKIKTYVTNLEWYQYSLPNRWKPKLNPQSLLAKEKSIDLNYSTASLNDVSTGVDELDSMIFLNDYRKAFNSVFKSDANIDFSAEMSNDDLFIVGTNQSDKIKGGLGDDVLVAGEGENRITSIGGNDIIFAGSGKDIYDIRGKGHRFIVGLTPEDLNGDQIIGEIPTQKSHFDRMLHTTKSYDHKTFSNVVFSAPTRIGDNLLLGHGKSNATVTIVDYFSHKNTINMTFSNQHELFGGSNTKQEKTSNFNNSYHEFKNVDGFYSYQSLISKDDVYQDIINSKMFKNVNAITKSYEDNLNI